MSDSDDKPGAANPVADPFDAEIEARAAELRALIAATPAPAPYALRPAGSSCASVAASATFWSPAAPSSPPAPSRSCSS